MTAHPTGLATGVLLGALLLTSCASDASTTPTEPGPTSMDSAPLTPRPSSTALGLGDPVGVRQTTRATNRYSLKLYPLQRDGKTVTLIADLVVDRAEDSSPVVRDLLADETDVISRSKGTVNGFGLIDGKNQKLYMPATTGENADTAVCSPLFPSHVETGDTITLSCTYAEIPTNVTTLTVRAPNFGTYANVPIR